MKGQVSIAEIDPMAPYFVYAIIIITVILLAIDKLGGIPV